MLKMSCAVCCMAEHGQCRSMRLAGGGGVAGRLGMERDGVLLFTPGLENEVEKIK